MPYRPRHRTQDPGSADCGPVTWQHLIDHATEGTADFDIPYLRGLAGRPYPEWTNISDAQRAIEGVGLNYRLVKNGAWSLLVEALRDGKGVQLCISYAVINDLKPNRSGDPGFRKGHSLYIQELRRRRDNRGRVTLSFDSLYDGAGAPDGPRWISVPVLRRAAQAFAGTKFRWWGGIVRDHDGPLAEPEPGPQPAPPTEPEPPIDPNARTAPGIPFPDDSTGEDLEPDEPISDTGDGGDQGEELEEPDGHDWENA